MREFKVGDEVISEELGKGVVTVVEKNKTLCVYVAFSSGRVSTFTNSGWYYPDNSSPHTNIKHKEENMFTKDDLKTGMVVEYRNGIKHIVVKDEGIIIATQGFDKISSFRDDLSDICDIRKYDIVKVYGQPNNKADYINLDAERKLIWQREETEELTMEVGGKQYHLLDIEKALNGLEPVR